MSDAKLQVIERIDELLTALTAYEDRTDRRVELIVRPDGSFALMGEEVLCGDDGMGFELIDECEDMAYLMATLQGIREADCVAAD